ncbi:MAG: hypothetical protein ACD_44C00400G0005 [uncultured bacterium]|nr:MAG: hypothetical protein ACD_44C00400G0005 [uncultured bacterium]
MQMKNFPSLRLLLHDWVTLSKTQDITCEKITLDSRTVEPGSIFFAIPGLKEHGKIFMEEALSKGARAVVSDSLDENHVDILNYAEKKIPLIYIQNLKKYLGCIASRFYQHPQHTLDLIGITGTNGKTSCSHFIANALRDYGTPCGVIGTLGYGIGAHLHPLNNTTPDIFTLYHILRELHDQGARCVAMEVSSHALKQERIQGLKFKVGIFTNLTQDHLDYHGTMEDYAQCKKSLFHDYPVQSAILNIDDPHGLTWLDTIPEEIKKQAYSLHEKASSSYPLTHVQSFNSNKDGVFAAIKTPWGDGVFHSPLLGKFNLSNLLATLCVLGTYPIPLPEILHLLSQLDPVPGRMEKIGSKNQPFIIVDYAHTPDALQKTLETLRPYCQGALWCVFGCGGNRDKMKRSMMGCIAEKNADNVILTDDNPRDEDPKEIIHEILRGFKNKNNIVVEHDRRRAIFHAINCAKNEDIVLIAGKGHEHYQQLGNKKIPFNDSLEAKLALENRTT